MSLHRLISLFIVCSCLGLFLLCCSVPLHGLEKLHGLGELDGNEQLDSTEKLDGTAVPGFSVHDQLADATLDLTQRHPFPLFPDLSLFHGVDYVRTCGRSWLCMQRARQDVCCGGYSFINNNIVR